MAALPKFVPRDAPESRGCGRLLVSGVTSSLGKVIDISGSGARVSRLGAAGVRPGYEFVLVIHSDPTGPFPVTAKLARDRRTGFLRHECALVFVNPSAEVRAHLSKIASTCGAREVEWKD